MVDGVRVPVTSCFLVLFTSTAFEYSGLRRRMICSGCELHLKGREVEIKHKLIIEAFLLQWTIFRFFWRVTPIGSAYTTLHISWTFNQLVESFSSAWILNAGHEQRESTTKGKEQKRKAKRIWTRNCSKSKIILNF